MGGSERGKGILRTRFSFTFIKGGRRRRGPREETRKGKDGRKEQEKGGWAGGMEIKRKQESRGRGRDTNRMDRWKDGEERKE